ncbi:MAG: hypothetical protein GX797_03765 [Chloroflexi bacterium]|nr:hypothetical protein [Chloroflexota bacterium]
MRPYSAQKSEETLIVRRGKFLTLLQTALTNREYQFARQAALIWLASYPGDLLVNFIYAQVLAELGDTEMAVTNLEKILSFDPEFVEATNLLDHLLSHTNSDIAASKAYLQRGSSSASIRAGWLPALVAARNAYEAGDLNAAEKSVMESLAHNPKIALPAIFHMQIVNQNRNYTLLHTLSGIYAARWSNCVQVKVLSAIADLQHGDDAQGVEKLHWSAAHDASGQVVNRLLGPNHNFKPLWPEDLKVYMDLPVPATIAAELGWNVLSQTEAVAAAPPEIGSTGKDAGDLLDDEPTLANQINAFMFEEESEVSGPVQVDYSEVPTSSFFLQDIATPIPNSDNGVSKEPENLPGNKALPMEHDPKTAAALKAIEEIQHDFATIASKIKKSELIHTDGRFPNYVIMTSRQNLEQKYGENTASVVIETMRDLALKIVSLPGWNSCVFVPDDPQSTQEFNLNPISKADAWKLKLALTDLDQVLAARGEMIGALLIVGGDEIVPFHLLPNPTDDSDLNVPSDNPYATIDENYFIQKWPVGRLPDEKGSDAGYLLEQLRFLNNEYDLKVKSKKSLDNNPFARLLDNLTRSFSQFSTRFERPKNISCTAEVWKSPSSFVFSVIDRAERIKTSPPTTSTNLLQGQSSNPKYAYFNLHGLEDAPEWYGQKDLTRRQQGPEYPVAMLPENFSTKSSAPMLVLSEACFGANILDKKVSESIALNFLASGSRAFVGSTCTAYGSVSKPLIAADLLAWHFWKFIVDGQSAGYALMQAKLALAKNMTTNQGYLDGEDQKTILSFVLYGDPLATARSVREVTKPAIRPTLSPELKTISDSPEEMVVAADEMPSEILGQIKAGIKNYLPGLDDAVVAINPQLSNFTLDPDKVEEHRDQYDLLKASQRYVVTLKKQYAYKSKKHNHIARVTFDQKGEMLKLSMSR